MARSGRREYHRTVRRSTWKPKSRMAYGVIGGNGEILWALFQLLHVMMKYNRSMAARAEA